MKVSEFKTYLQRGLGRCYLQLSACENKEKYRKAVLYGCLHNCSYDLQSEGTRADYIYELCSLFGDTEYFLKAITEKFEKLPASHGDYEHLCDLLSVFASEGSAEAKAVLAKKYAELYAKLINKRTRKLYNPEGSNFERIAVNLVWLDGLSAFLKIAEDMGNLLLKDESCDGGDFEWFYISFRDDYGEAELKQVLEENSQTSPAIKKFFGCMHKEEEDLQGICQSGKLPVPTAEELLKLVDEGKAEKLHFVRFGRLADNEQKRILAEKVMQESDQNKQAELLQAFMCDGFPLGVDGLADLFEHANQNLRFAITDVLEETIDPKAHDIAVDFIKMDGNYIAGIKMLIKNYTEADRELLISALNNLDLKKVGADGVHDIGSAILDAYSENVDLPREALEFLYENSYCAYCRECAVEKMSKRGWLTEEIKAECAHDSNLETRELVGGPACQLR